MYFVQKVFKTDKAFAFTTHRFNIPTTYYPCPMETGKANPEMQLVRHVLFAYDFLPSASGTGPSADLYTHSKKKGRVSMQAKQYCQERVFKMTFLPCGF